MSSEAVLTVHRVSRQRGLDFLVLLHVADQCDEQGYADSLGAWQIADAMRLPKSRVRAILRELEKSGELIVIRWPGYESSFQIAAMRGEHGDD